MALFKFQHLLFVSATEEELVICGKNIVIKIIIRKWKRYRLVEPSLCNDLQYWPRSLDDIFISESWLFLAVTFYPIS